MILDIFAQSSDTVGIIGVILLLIAYYLLSTSKMSPHSLRYQLLNLSGAMFILFSLMFHWNTASVLIEFAWITISLIGIIRIRKKRGNNQPEPTKLYVISDREKNSLMK